MNRSNLPRILIPLSAFVFAFALLYTSYYLFPGFSEFIDSKVPWFSTGADQNTFGGLNPDDYIPALTPAVEVFQQFLIDSDAYSPNNANSPYWQNWNWQTHFFWAEVSGVDYENQTVDLQFGAPETYGLIKGVQIQCDLENTISYAGQNLTLQQTGFGVFTELEQPDFFYSQCLNEQCTAVGNYCIIIDRTPTD